MSIKRIPVMTSLDPEGSNGSLDKGSETVNCVYDRYSDGATYATQRPGITIVASPSGDGIGRGVYYWANAGSFYIVNDGNIQAGHGAPQTFIGYGKDKVHFAELGNFLVIIDPENNKGWYIDIALPNTAVEILDVDFPPNQVTTRFLAGGVVSLDGFLFILDTGGTIWQSAVNDPTSWSALDFISAEREQDSGVFIGKHHDQIVVLGTRSIEFFYNAGNATGSVLNRRQDVSYRTGCIHHNSVASTGDRVYFIGTEQSGTLGLYGIESFRLDKKTNMSIDESLSFLGLRREQDFLLSFTLINDHYSIFVTSVLPDQAAATPRWLVQSTFVFDETVSVWSQFKTALKGLETFPVISVSDKEQGIDRTVTMLFTNGDLVELTNLLEPLDTLGDSAYFEQDDYIENQPDYIITVSQDVQETIAMSLTINEYDKDTLTYKYGHALWVVGTVVAGAQRTVPLLVSWSDDHYNTFSTPREVDVDMRRKLPRLGNFRRRAHRIEYDGPDTVRIEGLEMDVRSSRYA